MTSQNDDDEIQPVDPLAPKEAPETRAMFGAKAYEYTLERMRDIEAYARLDGKHYYRRQMAYYEFVKNLIETIDQEELEKQAGQAKWRKRK
jgi:hypothetical protein